MRVIHKFSICLLLAGLFSVVSCGSGHSASESSTSGSPTKIDVSGLATSGDTVNSVGETVQLTAEAVWPGGATNNISAQARWSSSNEAVATVSSMGLVTIVGAGTSTITATYEDKSASVIITATAAQLKTLAVTPATSTVALGKTQPYTATGTFSDGTTHNISSSVTWTVGTPQVIAVDTGGISHSLAQGVSTITATSHSIAAHASMTVGPPVLTSVAITPASPLIPLGATVQFTATATYSDGTTADITSTFPWSASPPTVVTIDSAGRAHGAGRGSFTISGGSGDEASQLSGVVSDPAAQRIRISPSSAAAPRHANRPFRATAILSDGSRQDVSSWMTWTSSDPTIATVNGSTGVATTVAPGTVQISGTYTPPVSAHAVGAVAAHALVARAVSNGQTFSSAAPLTVMTATVSNISVNAIATAIAKGTTTQFSAIATLSDGSTIDVTSIADWVSSVPTVAGLSGAGVASGILPGNSIINASYGGRSMGINLTITAATLVSIVISPQNPTIAVGGALQLHAIGTFSDGTTQDVTSILTYASSDTSVGTVTNDGWFEALVPGVVTIAASQGSAFVSFPVNITSATVLGVTVNAVDTNIPNGTDEQFTASARLSDGTTQDVTNSAAWDSSPDGIASVDVSGLASAWLTGTTTITAQYGGQTGSASLTVDAAHLVSIAIIPAHPRIPAGGDVQLVATGTFSDGSTDDITSTLSFSTSDPTIATVSSDGIIHFVSPGTVTVTVTQNSVTTSFQVTSLAATVTGLALTPTTLSVARSTSAQFSAHATLSDSSTVDVTNSATWSSSSSTIAGVNSDGLATAVTAGAATIGAEYGGQSASANLTVSTATLTSIAISPSNPFVTSGSTVQLRATGTFSDSSTQDLTNSLTYQSSNPSVVSVSSDGALHFVAPGTATITVTDGGVSFSFLVTSSGATISTVTVSPSTQSVAKGLTTQFSASVALSDGSTQNVTNSAVWASSVPAVATVNSSGLASGVTQGATSISAQYGGQTGSAGLTVSSPTLIGITVTPPTPSIPLGTTQQFTATGNYSDGSTSDVTNFVTWSAAPTTSATIDSSGLAHTVARGAITITATSSALSGHVTGAVSDAIAQQLQINPASTSIPRGSTHSFHANALLSDGSLQDVTSLTTWQSSDNSVVTVDSAGVASAVAVGSAQISGTYQGLSASASVVITNATVTSLAVTPSAPSVAKGTTQQFTAIASLSDGSTQNITTSTAWTSSALSVATMSPTGVATTLNAGSSTITGQYGGRVATANLTVTTATLVSITIAPSNPTAPSGGTLQLHATGTFSDGSTQDVTNSLTYLSSAPLTASVGTDGVLHGGLPGTATITASKGSASKSFTVTVNVAVLTGVTVTPASTTLVAGSTQQYTATGQYSDGSSQDLTSTASWTSTVPSVASVDSQGKAAGVTAGTTTISAASSLITGSTDLTVTAATVAAITVSPATSSIAAGQTQAYNATATLSDTTTQDVTTSAHWAAANSAVAQISNDPGNNGIATGVAAGTTQVTASLGGITGNAALTVSSASLVSLAITPQNQSVAVGIPLDLDVTGTYSDGSTLDLTNAAHWSSSNGAVLSVVAGVVSPASVGSSTVSASLQGLSASTNVTVTAATLASIAVTPPSVVVPLGLNSQLSAIGTFSNASTQDVTSTVHWTANPSSIATVNSSGFVQSVAPGTSTITATLSGVTRNVNVTVSSASLQSITVTAPQTSFALGSNVQLTATGNYSDASTQNLTSTAQWSSTAPAVGTVNSSGLASGVSSGNFTANATQQAVTGGLALTTTPATLVSITVTPSGSLLHTLLHQFVATGHFSDGSTQVLTTGVHWSVSNGLLSTITQGGNLFPLGIGTFTVHATVGAIDGQAVITLL